MSIPLLISKEVPKGRLRLLLLLILLNSMMKSWMWKHTKVAELLLCKPMDFKDAVDGEAIDLIEKQNQPVWFQMKKYVVSMVLNIPLRWDFVKAHAAKYPDLTVVQIDAHSDLRLAYHDNPYSHASVMARVYELDIPHWFKLVFVLNVKKKPTW